MKELKDPRRTIDHVLPSPLWNPVKELKGHAQVLSTSAIIHKWNPVKELKVTSDRDYKLLVAADVESGEGIERTICLSATRFVRSGVESGEGIESINFESPDVH